MFRSGESGSGNGSDDEEPHATASPFSELLEKSAVAMIE